MAFVDPNPTAEKPVIVRFANASTVQTLEFAKIVQTERTKDDMPKELTDTEFRLALSKAGWKPHEIDEEMQRIANDNESGVECPMSKSTNPKLSQAGRKGGTSGRGQSKVRPLTQERARQMAVKRWSKPSDIVKPVARVTQERTQRHLGAILSHGVGIDGGPNSEAP